MRGRGARALGIGEELPPNVLMRFGLRDIRNYDSVELERSLRWFAPLYEPAPARSPVAARSPGSACWPIKLSYFESGVYAVVAASPPPERCFAHIEHLGRVWVAWLDGSPWAESELAAKPALGSIATTVGLEFESIPKRPTSLVVRETFDPGWTAVLDGTNVEIQPESSVF